MKTNNINILCVTEHWLKNHEILFNFENHVVASSFCRVNAIRGGSLVLINNCLKFKERKDIVSLSVERTIEIACAELDRFIVVSVYRPPSSLYDSFEHILENVLLKLSASNKNIIVCGDFNINLLDDSSTTIRFRSLLKSYNLFNLFLEPTRITENTSSCIDNIFTDIIPKNKKIINSLNSDHCGQIISFNYNWINNKKQKIVFVPMTVRRIEKFKNSILAKCPYMEYNKNPSQQYDKFFKIINTEFKSIFSSKTCTLRNHLSFNEWATPGIHKSRQKLYDLYSEREFNRCDSFTQRIRKYSKLFNKVCSQARSLHIKHLINNSVNKIKMTWNIIKCESGKSKARNSNFTLHNDNQIIKSDKEVASAFENYFKKIPASTTSSLISSPVVAESLLQENVKKCNINFKFKKIVSKDIIKCFRTLNIKNTSDLWGMSVKVIGSIVDFVAPYLATIFNDCISCGVFPDLMKHSKVIPLLKSGNASDVSNYRPISVLPSFSKIFEKIILNQMLDHFNKNKLLHNKQFGFTKGRSTTDAGVFLIKHIFEAWEESQDALGVFCDLSKAFDCVQHETLVRKLYHYGIKNNDLKLLISYLSNRIQRVEVNGKRSSGVPIDMGVPQGSILGPFLFLVYINDLPTFVGKHNEIVLFADDTSLIFKVKRHQVMYDDVNTALSRIVHWFSVNNLLLNNKKTKLLRFSTSNVKQVQTNVLLNEEAMEVVESTVFLGITIDSRLQWGPHIAVLSSKLSSAAYAVKKIRSLTDESTAKLVYYSYFHSVMSYGILLWGSAADINTIFVLQKRAIRAIYNLGPRDSLRDKFKQINVLTVAGQYIFENLKYAHKNYDTFIKHSDIHNINTRNKHKLTLPVTRLKKVSKSFMGQCIQFYNKLPPNVQVLPCNKFKKVTKERLCAKGYYNISEYLEDDALWV